ncbi:unnamed protein product [Vicia faba]|uniref:No apical meristem-associated C-terminal domain-containing protein n=1 Tax=Vicia faba TaxID=3906 RepID=A0AAV0YQW3_VICFA|nr:unnamed protein product [Vicia faba]
MDPNQFNYQQSMFNFMQNFQNPNPQNSQFPSIPTNSAAFFPSSIGNTPPLFFRHQTPPYGQPSMEFFRHEPETPIVSMSESQVPPFSTQVGIEKEESRPVKKKAREVFSRDEDILLIQSWLNVSNDSIVGVDQKAESFWLRITTNYNEYRGQSREKLCGQLKSRWHRINGLVQKFVGCYKQAVNGKKSGTSEKDILAAAYEFLSQDESTPFNLEYAWRLLKDEPKWMGASTENSSKRTKNFVSGAHSSSSNLATPSSYEFNSSSPMERPMGQQAAKRKSKAKENASESPSNVMQETWNKRVAAMEILAQCKEDGM